MSPFSPLNSPTTKCLLNAGPQDSAANSSSEPTSSTSSSDPLQLMERRQLRQFSRADEYLYAMKEDLAEWLNLLYGIDIDADSFMDVLETGEHLIKVGTGIKKGEQR